MKKLLAAAALTAVVSVAVAATPAHPRLFADANRFREVSGFCRTNEIGRAYADRIVRLADAFLPTAPVVRQLEGRRLLGVSREALSRILTLGFAWRHTDDARYLERGLAELDAVCAFSDWHPQHYLDVGEMALAASVGYDWFYDRIPAEKRSAYARSIARCSLETWTPAKDDTSYTVWWENSQSNWNAVCNAGTLAACWALWDDPAEGALAQRLFRRASRSVAHGLECYAPIGAYLEGPMYWGYGTAFACLAVELVREATGTDDALAAAPGFARTCEYLDRMTGPSGKTFDFGDGRPLRDLEFPSFWLARRFNRPDTLARHERGLLLEETRRMSGPVGEGCRLNPLIALWLDGGIPEAEPQCEPAFWFSGATEVPCCSLSLPNGTWVALKGGKAAASHMHMDAGTFVYEACGRRFVSDCGMEPYHNVEKRGINLWDGSQNGARWKCFRLGPEAHAVARVNGRHHDVKGMATFVSFETNALPYRLTLDTSACYGGSVRSTRLYTLEADGAFTVTDRFGGLAEGDVVTSQLPLARDGYRLAVRRGEPDAMRLTVVSDAPYAVSDQAARLESWAKPLEPTDRVDFTKAAGHDGTLEITYTLVPPAASEK